MDSKGTQPYIYMYPCVPAKSLQSCLILCDPVDQAPPPGSSVQGILNGLGFLRFLLIFFPQRNGIKIAAQIPIEVVSHSVVSDSLLPLGL